MGTQFILLSAVLLCALMSLGEATNDTSTSTTQELSSTSLLFNCDRHDQDCEDGRGNCDDSGVCVCDGGFTGLKCEYDELSPCTLTCLNGGECVRDRDSGNETCSCTSLYTGDDCGTDRITVDCHGTEMDLSVNLVGLGSHDFDFEGKIYLGLNNSDTACCITQNNVTGLHSGTYDIDESHCDGYREYYDVNNVTGYIYTKQMTIQFSPLFISGNDPVLNFSCFHDDSDTASVNINAVVAIVEEAHDGDDAPSNIKPAVDAIAKTYAPASMQILNTNDASVSGGDIEVELGDTLTLDNTLSDTSIYKELAVESCTVTDPDNDITLQVIEDRCVTEQAKKIMPNDPSGSSNGDDYTVSYEIKVFKLTDSTTQLHVECEVNLCKSVNSTRCTPDCDSKRRKRAANKYNLKQQKTDAWIKIKSTKQIPGIITLEDYENCEVSETTKISLIALAGVCVVLLVVSIGQMVYIIRSRGAKIVQSQAIIPKANFMSPHA